VRRVVANHSDVMHVEARTPAQIEQVLTALAASGVEVLAVNGGDGTVQAVITSLFERRPFTALPVVAVLRGGTTNMTAGDVGLRGGVLRALRRLLEWEGEVELIQRPVLRVESKLTRDTRCGMFFGIGIIVSGIEYFHARVRGLGLGAAAGPGVAIARGLLAFGRRDPKFVSPVTVRMGVDGAPCEEPQDVLLLLVSTLERLFFGIHPYWGKEVGPLRVTRVQAQPRRLLRVFPSLLRGRPSRLATAESGYRSCNVRELRLAFDGAFTLDGEIYPVRAEEGSLRISNAGALGFLRI